MKDERFNLADIDLQKIAEFDIYSALNKAELVISEEEVAKIKEQINETISKGKRTHDLFINTKLKSNKLEQIELPTFNYLSVLYAVNSLEARQGLSPILNAIKKQANKQKRVIDLL